MSDPRPLGRGGGGPAWEAALPGGQALGPSSGIPRKGWHRQARAREGWCGTHAVEFPAFLRGSHPPGVIHAGLALVVLDLGQQESGVRASAFRGDGFLPPRRSSLPGAPSCGRRAAHPSRNQSSGHRSLEGGQELGTHTEKQLVTRRGRHLRVRV